MPGPANSGVWPLGPGYAFAAQQLASGAVGNEFSGFFGTLIATPLGYLIHLRFRGPPAMVTFLPSFWILVPGALGLLSVKQMLSDRAIGVDGLVTVVFVIASIARGTLMGASLYRWTTESLGAWQLQVGRVGDVPAAQQAGVIARRGSSGLGHRGLRGVARGQGQEHP